ncbi:MAG TPA: UDP-glucose 4-epimerase GalE [Acidimicrobiales bacterium]|nr:UDP-glucose 4-epimerase GalE [Acidimicrobiales bacterium]
MSSRRVLLTGGAGYIGSHTAVELLHAGWSVVVVDNLSNAKPVVIDRIRELAAGDIELHVVDLLDRDGLKSVFGSAAIDAVVHFAGLKAVGESTHQPLRYYENNVAGTVNLLTVMAEHGVRDLGFSSSCTVYGEPQQLPVDEGHPRSATNPYGRTKLMIEEILEDVAAADDGWRIAMLRYFNPVGAHPSGTIGEDPKGVPNNLMPFAMQVAVGRQPRVRVFGNDYPTADGTGVRDYIHVVDLALGHLVALEALPRLTGCESINLGTGRGRSVLEVVKAASVAVGAEIPYEIVDRRPGDIAATWADPSKAASLLGWTATRSLADMCADHWRWQSCNPDGYPA